MDAEVDVELLVRKIAENMFTNMSGFSGSDTNY